MHANQERNGPLLKMGRKKMAASMQFFHGCCNNSITDGYCWSQISSIYAASAVTNAELLHLPQTGDR
jgi:hypothetical protein